ncbi:MAG TPA: hypothetical protein ENJ97_02255, partial [Planctomycetes bacterium]|nr:hypothetical protein [Planctomycetota bacterium]
MKRDFIFLLTLGAVLSPTLLSAQAKVFPPSLEKVEGNTSFNAPFSYYQGKYQQLILGGALPFRSGTIQAVGWRRDGKITRTYKSRVVELAFLMGTVKTTPQGMSPVFAKNWTSPPTLVFPRSKVNLPALPAPTSPPAPFALVLRFPTGKAFPYKGGNLLMEMVQYKSYPGGYTVYARDAFQNSSPWYPGEVSSLGKGCPGKNGLVPAITVSPGDLVPFHTFTVRLTHGPKARWFNLPAVNWLGVSTSAWGRLILPLDLAPYGAKGCRIYTDMVIRRPMFLRTPQGKNYSEGKVSYYIPPDPSLLGSVFYTQCLTVDWYANPGHVTVSNALKLRLSSGKAPLRSKL